MWINKAFFEFLRGDVLAKLANAGDVRELGARNTALATKVEYMTAQKSKDDVMIDWFRVRINHLERQVSVFMRETTHLNFPAPEIQPLTPPRKLDIDHSLSFEDMGEAVALKLGIKHDDDGNVVYSE